MCHFLALRGQFGCQKDRYTNDEARVFFEKLEIRMVPIGGW